MYLDLRFYVFELTLFVFELTLFVFELTPSFCIYPNISKLQRNPNPNILLAYLCIYVDRLLYTKTQRKKERL